MFTSFTNHFFRAVWHVRAIILALIALVVSGAAMLAYLEKIAFAEALYFAFVTGMTIGYGDIVSGGRPAQNDGAGRDCGGLKIGRNRGCLGIRVRLRCRACRCRVVRLIAGGIAGANGVAVAGVGGQACVAETGDGSGREEYAITEHAVVGYRHIVTGGRPGETDVAG